MGSDQKPETWGYGLTWLVTIGLVALITFGAFKLTVTAKESAAHLEEEKKKAVALGLEELKKNNAEVEEKLKAAEAAAKAEAEKAIAAANPTNAGEGDPAKGKVLYMNCMACHGPNAQGNPALKSPPLAGQEAWYLESSLKKFMKGIRGGDIAKDPAGGQMAMMVKQFIKTDQDVKDVVAYIRTIKPTPIQHTLKGNAASGQALYMTCIPCHGDKGQGNPATKGPALVTLPDWYVVEQIKKFKSGIRGAHPEDMEGKLMAPMSQMLATDDMIKNVAEYIKTLKK